MSGIFHSRGLTYPEDAYRQACEAARTAASERDALAATVARVRELADEWDEVADKWPYAHWHNSQKANAASLRAALDGGGTDA